MEKEWDSEGNEGGEGEGEGKRGRVEKAGEKGVEIK